MLKPEFLDLIKKLADLFDFTLSVQFENGKPIDFFITKNGGEKIEA